MCALQVEADAQGGDLAAPQPPVASWPLAFAQGTGTADVGGGRGVGRGLPQASRCAGTALRTLLRDLVTDDDLVRFPWLVTWC